MDNWMLIWKSRNIFLQGFIATIEIFLLSSLIGFFIGLCLLYLLEGKENKTRKIIQLFVNSMRTLPFLIFAYLLYYGLPEYGITLSGYQAGLIGLSLYHGAYFCEILRSQRLVMPKGLIEAAVAHGFKHRVLFIRMILPNVIMSSLPMLGNQLINCLKDSAFLSILTVEEITFAANNIQSIYYIPIQTFTCAILLYWLITLGIEFSVNNMIKLGHKRGLSHGK